MALSSIVIQVKIFLLHCRWSVSLTKPHLIQSQKRLHQTRLVPSCFLSLLKIAVLIQIDATGVHHRWPTTKRLTWTSWPTPMWIYMCAPETWKFVMVLAVCRPLVILLKCMPRTGRHLFGVLGRGFTQNATRMKQHSPPLHHPSSQNMAFLCSRVVQRFGVFLLRCLWKRREVVLELQWFREQQDLWFSWPPPPPWMPPPLLAFNQVRTKVNPPGICHPPWCTTPHGKHHPPPWKVSPPSLWWMAMAAAEYIGLWGQISR